MRAQRSRRPAVKSDITDTAGSRHIPGYAGHIPGLDAGTEKTFGDATANAFLQTAASTIAMERRYAQAGLALPSALPWAKSTYQETACS